MSVLGHSRPTPSVPVPINVRCYSSNDIIGRRSEVTLRAMYGRRPRCKMNNPDLEYKLAAREPLFVFLPSDHRLAGHKAIDPHDLVGEKFIGISEVPHTLRTVVSGEKGWSRA